MKIIVEDPRRTRVEWEERDMAILFTAAVMARKTNAVGSAGHAAALGRETARQFLEGEKADVEKSREAEILRRTLSQRNG